MKTQQDTKTDHARENAIPDYRLAAIECGNLFNSLKIGCRIQSKGLHMDGKWKHRRFAVSFNAPNLESFCRTYKQGLGIKESPVASEVFACLCSDYLSADDAGSFDSWCSEFGYSNDSISASATYKQCLASIPSQWRGILGMDNIRKFADLNSRL